jgi:hypothetical protein
MHARWRFLVLVLVIAMSVVAPVEAQDEVIFITKILVNPKGQDTGANRHVNREYLVITSGTGNEFSIDGWELHDRDRESVYEFPSVENVNRIVVHSGRGEDWSVTGCNGDCYTTTHLYWGRRRYVWDNKGDRAVLRDDAGDLVDACRYGKKVGRSKDCSRL